MTTKASAQPPLRRRFKRVWNYRYILMMVLPVIALLIVFSYVPMLGNVLAFKEFSIRRGIWNSDWVGLKYFRQLWGMPQFWSVFSNQLIISFMKLLIGFPYPIVLALLINEVRSPKIRRSYQTAYTFPHFLSWIVIAGIIKGFLADQGLVNQMLLALNASKHRIFNDGDQFRVMLYLTEVWKEGGWNSILYLATLSTINPSLYEAAEIDGAGRWQKILYITWPGLYSTAAILLILSVGNVLSGGFDQIINLYNSVVMQKADIIDTYIYRTAISAGSNYSFATAVGLFKSVINVALLIIANTAVRRMGQEGIL